MKESAPVKTYSRSPAVYKGVTVAVYKVDKAEISLTRQDFVELINVRSLWPTVGGLHCGGPVSQTHALTRSLASG